MIKDEHKKHNKDTPFNRVPKMSAFDKELTVYDIAVLNSICSFINSKTDSWAMPRKDIAERAHIKDLHTIDKCIKKLVLRGYLKFISGGEGVANFYTVTFPKVDANLYTKGKKSTPAPISEIANSNVIPITRKNLPKKVLKAPADKQEPIIQAIFDYWIENAKKRGIMEHAELKNKHAIKQLLKDFTPVELLSIICFIWNFWIENNHSIADSQIDMGILNSPSLRASIINQYKEFEGWGYDEDDFEDMFNEITKKNAPNSATNTDESLPKKMQRVQTR